MTNDSKYPDGKLCDGDDGALELKVGVKDGRVVIDFGKPVAWFALPPALVYGFISMLAQNAAKASGKPVSVTINQEGLLVEAKQVVEELEKYFSDTSRSKSETLEGLLEIQEETENRIMALRDDIALDDE